MEKVEDEEAITDGGAVMVGTEAVITIKTHHCTRHREIKSLVKMIAAVVSTIAT